MQHLQLSEQLHLLDEYSETQRATIKEANEILDNLKVKKARDHFYASRKQDLRIRVANEKLQWVAEFKGDLNKRKLDE